MRMWVTGAAGFVGSRLLVRLRSAGHDVVGCDREVDVRDRGAVHAAVAACMPDVIFHLAAVTFVPEAQAEPALAFRVNVLGTQHVLAAAEALAPRARIVAVSSAAVYGAGVPGAAPFDESAPLRPDSAYARTKAAADLLAGEASRRGLDVVRARPFNHTGAGRPDSFVESSLARQLAEIEAGRREPLLRVGNLDSVRDFLHVDDVIDAYTRLADPALQAGVYNVASGAGVTIRELLALLLARSSARPRTEVDPRRLRPTDASVGDARRLAAATGWAPSRSLDDTLGELLDDWRARVRGAA